MPDAIDTPSVYKLPNKPGKYNPGAAVRVEFAQTQLQKLNGKRESPPRHALSKYYPGGAMPAQAGGSDSGDKFNKRTLYGKPNLRSKRLERVLSIRHYRAAQVIHTTWATVPVNQGIDRSRKHGGSKNAEGNMERSIRRSRVQMRRDMLSVGAQIMWTFTYASNMKDRAKAIRDRQEFDRRMKIVYPHWAGVAVMEQQKRGAWHWHIAVRGFYDVKIVRALWQKTIKEKAMVNVGFKPDGKGNCYTKLATYMSKYMGKNIEQAAGEKNRYHTFGNVERPMEKFVVPLMADHGLEKLISLEVAVDLFGKGECLDVYESRYGLPNGGGFMAISKRETKEGG